jgi:hypothetical protein
MSDGWVITMLIPLLGFLVLVGIIANASGSRDEQSRRRRDGHLTNR